MFLSRRRILSGISVTFFVLVSHVSAQNSNDRGTPADSKKGQSTQSTYARDKIETVNLANGNLSLAIPLATIGGRGSASFTVTLSYNSKVWSIQSDRNGVYTELGAQGTPRNLYSAIYDNLQPEDNEPYLAKLGGGWSILMAPGIKLRTVGIDPQTSGCNHYTDGQRDCGFKYALSKMWVTLPDGSQVELRDVATQGAPHLAVDNDNGYRYFKDRDRGRIWRSVDGSNIVFVRNTGYSVGHIAGANEFPSGWVFLPDGTRLQMDQGVGTKIIDRNGNFVSLSGNTWTDQLGRQITIGGIPLAVTVKGYLGTPDRSFIIDFGTIGDQDNLRSDFLSLPRPFTTGDAFRNAQDEFTDHMIPTAHTDLFAKSEGMIHNYGAYEGLDVSTKTALTRLNLLDGRSLRFRYNQYGEVAEIVYPGGGVSRIDYEGGIANSCEIAAPFGVNRSVTQRRSLKDNGTVEATWLYSPDAQTIDGISRPGMSIRTYQGDANGSLLSYERHFFRMLNAEYRGCGGAYTFTANEKWENAKEFRTEIHNGTGTTVTTREWQQRAALVWANDVGASNNAYANEQYHGQEQPPNDPRVAWQETTLEDGKTTRVEYGYDQFNNVTSIKEYDFGTAGAPGALLRQTFRTYVSSLNGYCYSNLNPADSSCGSGIAADVATIIYQPSLLLSETIKDGQGNQKAYSELEYDNYSTAANHAGIVINSGMIQYDGSRFAAFSSAAQPRGNVTKTTRWLSGGTDIVGFSQYDNAGQVIWSKDPNGYVSTVSYTDNFGSGDSPDSGIAGPNGATFALPSLAINAAGHQTKVQYNYALGAATGVKDPNGVISKTEYDSLGRPFRTTSALGLAAQSVSLMSYPTLQENSARVSRQLDGTRWVTAKTDFDRFDRPIASWQSEDGQPIDMATFTIRVHTIYDALGRVKEVSNPYRPTTEAPIYTTTAYDLAGRLTSVTTSDSAVVSTSYYANTVTVSDQKQRQRKSVMDALGRLNQVYEAPNDSSYNYLTTYGYDTLDNLTSVSQGTQTRTFVYDSLKRLKSATNPESGTICYGTVAANVCQANGYDANGNLLYKTDARGIQSTYVYDGLNRNTSVDYSDTATNPDVTRVYDNPGNDAYGIGRLWESFAGGNLTAGTVVEHTKIVSYDPLGRPRDQRQRFKYNGAWQEYRIQRTYNLGGGVISQTYPSTRWVIYNYDGAGRLADKDAQSLAFTGNLGDGLVRTYSRGLTYSALGGLTQEQFGTDTAIYNKLAYNSRGQLAEIKESTTPNDSSWNRGKIVNWYSLQCGFWSAAQCNGADNNGNLRKQETFIPHNEQNTSSTSWYQQYEYDSLNRLTEVHEHATNNSLLWHQSFAYDRYGNRTIDANGTSDGINKQNFEVETATNRLLATGDSALTGASLPQRKMRYDQAGNLTNDSWSSYGSSAAGAATRTYDAENRMTSAWDSSGGVSYYTYNAEGQRVRRTGSGQPSAGSTWQVYGMDGELLAEYAANAAPASPQKEYGYRGGQLLITAEAAARTNVAVSTNGGSALASSTNGTNGAANAINGDRRGSGGVIWMDNTHNTAPDWLEINFNGSKTINEIDVVTRQDDVSNPVEPSLTQTFSLYGITAFEVQYWNGSGWTTVPGGSVSGNNKVWRQFTFASVTTTKIRVVVNAVADGALSRIVEVEAYAALPSTNKALPANGAVASASSYFSDPTWGSYPPAFAIDGSRRATNHAHWMDNTVSNFQSDWIEINFNGNQTINQIDVVTQQDDYQNPVEPTLSQTFSLYGITAFEVQYWNGSGWVTVPNGSVTGNNKVWRQFTFPAITTSKIRVVVTAGADNVFSRVVEVEAWAETPATANINWLVTDQLGTPRMVFDKTGALDKVRRHDYLPFGEELSASVGLRNSNTNNLGYAVGDTVRQKFTSKERDDETGLDYFGARYFSSAQGRFTSPDDFLNDTHAADPKSWNLYTYVRNNPLRYVDPDGRIQKDANGNIIFKKTGEATATFATDKPLKDTDGNVVKDKNGKPMTFSVSWKVETGYVRADDGTKIEAQRATGEMQVEVKDGSGNVLHAESAKAQNELKAAGFDNQTDCHGTTFAKGQVWINNDQVKKILGGDGYVQTSTPTIGDVGVYTKNGNLGKTQHSVLVNTIDAQGSVVDVSSKSGIRPRVNAAPGPGANSAWQDPNVKLQYFTQRTSQPKR